MADTLYPNITFIPLDTLTTPQDGDHCKADRWWVVHPEHGALVYKGFAPQCNRDRRFTKELAELYPGCEVRFIPMAFVDRL